MKRIGTQIALERICVVVGSFRKLALGELGDASFGTYKLGKLAIFRKLDSGENLGEVIFRQLDSGKLVEASS